MQITSGQQYNVGEKPTVILYIYINRQCRDTRKALKTRQCNTPSHRVVVICITKVVNTKPLHNNSRLRELRIDYLIEDG